MTPLISVIVPIYNVEKYLNECLSSIQSQTYKHLQIILIDDGSTDNSAQIAQLFVDNDPRFQLLRQANAGQSAARNRGIELATGDYISFIDADDYIAPEFYTTLIKAIQNADVIQIGYTKTDINSQPLQTYCPQHWFQYTSASMRLYRMDFLRKHCLHFEEGYIYEDVIFSLDMWMLQPTYRMLKYTGYYYRTNPTSTTSIKRDTRPLFRLLSQRRKAANLRGKFIILYTYIRLKTHFFLRR